MTLDDDYGDDDDAVEYTDADGGKCDDWDYIGSVGDNDDDDDSESANNDCDYNDDDDDNICYNCTDDNCDSDEDDHKIVVQQNATRNVMK